MSRDNLTIISKKRGNDRWSIFLIWIGIIFAQIPAMFKVSVPILDIIDDYLLMGVFGITFLTWLFITDFRIPFYSFPLIGYMIVVLFATLLNNGSVLKALYEFMKMSIFYFSISIIDSTEIDRFWKHIKAISIILLLFNFVFWIFNPFGMIVGGSVYYFYETPNETPNYIIPLIALLLLSLEREKSTIPNKVLIYALSIANTIMLLAIDCSTGKVGIVLFLVLYIFRKKVAKVTSTKVLLIAYATLLVLLVFLNLASIFSFLIVDVLGESLTLHTRTLAWEYAKQAFKLSPIIGKGYASSIYKYSPLCEFVNGRFSHSHCEFLEYLLRGGILGTSFFGMHISKDFIASNKLYKTSSKIQIIVFTIFTFLIMSVNETCFSIYFFMFLAILEHRDVLFDNMNEDNLLETKV